MKVIAKNIKWTASTSPDVVAHKVYWCPETDDLDYESDSIRVEMPKTNLILPDEAPSFPEEEGNFKIGISSVDDVGNESDIIEISFPFDFAAPDAPTNLVVEDV